MDSQSRQVQTYDSFSDPKIIGKKILEQLKEEFENESKTNFNEFIFAYPDIKMLCCYLFFSLAQKKVYQYKKINQVLQKLKSSSRFKENPHQYEILKKFYLDQTGNNSLIEVLKKKKNSIQLHKPLLQQVAKCLSIDQIIKLIRSGIKVSISLRKGKHKEELLTYASNVKIVIVEDEKMSYLVFYELADSNHKNQVQTKSQIKSEVKSEQEDERSKVIELEQKHPKKLQKSKSVGSQIEQPAKISQKTEVTWFEFAVLIVIIAALVAEFTSAFDHFLTEYNNKVGEYYFIELWYKLNNLLLRKGQESTL